MKERRRYLRFEVLMDIVFKLAREVTLFSISSTKNVYREGFCFATNASTPTSGSMMEFKIEIPGKGLFVNCLGKTICDSTMRNMHMAGVQLKDMLKDSRWQILDYCYRTWLATILDKRRM